MPLAGFTAAGWHTAALQRGRHTWTLLSLNEYRAASTLAYMAHLLALADAPLDIVSLASTLPQKELAHAEICTRVAADGG